MQTDRPCHRVLVTDGEQRATLAVVRSLGAAGHTVRVLAAQPHSLAGASRFARAEHTAPSALTEPAMFVDAVKEIADEHAIDIIIPMTEPALLALLPARSRFENVIIPFADAATFAAISDKQALLDAAEHVGIAIPAQTVLSTATDPSLPGITQYPVVVKPARSVSAGSGDRLKLSVQHAASEAELGAVIGGMDARAYPLLLQQRITGPGVGIFVLMWDGKLIAQFAHRRIREKPPSGGISVYRESIPVDPALLRASLDLLVQFRWNGVAMVEYKIDEKTGTPYLMEINGRFWGSLQLAIDAGVDFPKLLVDAATGLHPDPVSMFRTDVRSRWFWGEVDHLLARLRRSNEQLSLPAGAPSKWKAVRNFLSRHPDDVSEVCRAGDMRPFLRESIQWFQQLGQ